jgi:hypothetical protein
LKKIGESRHGGGHASQIFLCLPRYFVFFFSSDATVTPTRPPPNLRGRRSLRDFAHEFRGRFAHELHEMRAAAHRVEERALKVQAGEAAAAVLSAESEEGRYRTSDF